MLMMESVKQNSFNETKDSASIFVHRQAGDRNPSRGCWLIYLHYLDVGGSKPAA
jgi:hypothetical protein